MAKGYVDLSALRDHIHKIVIAECEKAGLGPVNVFTNISPAQERVKREVRIEVYEVPGASDRESGDLPRWEPN